MEAAMKRILTVAALAAAALGVAACEKPGTNTAYLNSGASATPAMPPVSGPSRPATEASPQDTMAASPGTAANEASTSPATSDTASPNTAPAPSK
jgi:hypothetical protein